MTLRIFLSVSLFFAFPACGGNLFGIPFTMQGQRDTALLYASMLAVPNEEQKLITLATQGSYGMGNYSYVMTLAKMIEESLPDQSVQKLMGGSSQDKNKVKQIFGFPKDESDFWFEVNSDEYAPAEVKQYFQRVKQSQVMLSLVYPPIEEIDPFFSENINFLYLREIHSQRIDPDQLKARYLDILPQVPAGNILTFEQSLSVYDPEDLDDVFDTDDSFYIDSFPHFNELTPSFGLNTKNIGLLLNFNLKQNQKPFGERVFQQAYSRMPDSLRRAMDELFVSHTILKSKKENTHFYTGYFQTLFGKLLFLHSLAHMDVNADMIIMLPLTEKDITVAAVIESLKSLPASTIYYWGGGHWQSLENKHNTEESSTANSERTLVIINPFPLDKQDYLALLNASGPVPVAGSTGDHSLYEVISSGRLPLHEYMPHQYNVNMDLASIAENELLKTFFTSMGSDHRADSLRQIKKQPEIVERYIARLYKQYNATPFLVELIKETMNENSMLWSSVKMVDEQFELESLPMQAASNDIDALAYGRATITLLSKMMKHEKLNKIEHNKYKEEINSFLIHLHLNYHSFYRMLKAISTNVLEARLKIEVISDN